MPFLTVSMFPIPADFLYDTASTSGFVFESLSPILVTILGILLPIFAVVIILRLFLK